MLKGVKLDRSSTSAIRIFPGVRVQRFGSVVADRFHDPQAFRPSLPEQDPITHRQILWPLHEAERYRCPIARPDEGSVDVDDGARLADGAHVQHGLILCFDGGRVREDQDFGDELPVDFGRGVEFGEDDHAFADFFSAHPFQSEGGGLAGAAHGDGDAFPFDGADVGCGELTEGVWPDQDGVAGMDDAASDDAGDDCADKGHGEGVVDVELEGGFGIVVSVVRKNVEKGSDEVEGFASHV